MARTVKTLQAAVNIIVTLKFAIVQLMTIALLVTFALMLLELGLWLPGAGRRSTAAALIASLLLPASVWLAVTITNPFTALFVFVAIYRGINLWRYAQQRRQPDHLYSLTRRASWWLFAAQIVSLVLLVTASRLTLQFGLYVVVGIGLVGSLIITRAAQHNLKKTRPAQLAALAANDLPTLSVLIPARDETDDLSQCLQSLIASTYPKLEIIVLDDCSQNKRTPEIIKGFAHDGVRFIAGTATPKNWLAKNFAYQQLEAVASGDILLFCGVDTRFQPETLELMVCELVQSHKTMVSFLPANSVPGRWEFLSLLVRPSQYAWELALPRRALERPPVLSVAWIINHAVLRASGGFAAAPRAATPERVFARFTAAHDDGYSFRQSETGRGVVSVNSSLEQRETALRTRYPQLHQSLELTALTTLTELLILVVPFVIYTTTLLGHNWLLFYTADITCILLISTYAQIAKITYRRFLFRSLWLLPFAAVYDIGLLNYSMYKYEFSSVEWKGRNICIPIMQVIEHLPKG